MKIARKTDYIIILAVALLAAVFLFRAPIMEWLGIGRGGGEAGAKDPLFAEIYIDNELRLRIPLSREFQSGTYDIGENGGLASVEHSEDEDGRPLEIFDFKDFKIGVYADGGVGFLESNCPDKVCVRTGKIYRTGDTAACVPNKAMIRIVSEKELRGDGSSYRVTLSGYFGTVSEIIGENVSREEFKEMADDYRLMLTELHGLYGIYEDEITLGDYGSGADGLFNLLEINKAGRGKYPVDKRLGEMLSYALDAYNLTEGAVNICLGRVLELWHEARDTGVLPIEGAVKEALDHVSHSAVRVREPRGAAGYAVEVIEDGVRLDTGAVSKGYALDLILDYLEEEYSGKSALLSIGGSIGAIGRKMDWKIGVKDPDGDGLLARFMLPVGKKVSSSGDYERFFEIDGRRYHHIIDPKTGWPAVGAVRSVTVVADSCALTDALSTALFILPVKEGLALAEELGAEVLYVLDAASPEARELEAILKISGGAESEGNGPESDGSKGVDTGGSGSESDSDFLKNAVSDGWKTDSGLLIIMSKGFPKCEWR